MDVYRGGSPMTPKIALNRLKRALWFETEGVKDRYPSGCRSIPDDVALEYATQMSDEELGELRHIGAKALEQIRAFEREVGLFRVLDQAIEPASAPDYWQKLEALIRRVVREEIQRAQPVVSPYAQLMPLEPHENVTITVPNVTWTIYGCADA